MTASNGPPTQIIHIHKWYMHAKLVTPTNLDSHTHPYNAKVRKKHGYKLVRRLQQAVLLNSIKVKCEGLGRCGLS